MATTVRAPVYVQSYPLTWYREWTFGSNINLIGAKPAPFKQTDWPNPTPVTWYRSSEQNLLETPFFKPLPFNQYDWPNPQPVRWYQDWNHGLDLKTESLNPFRQQDWPLPTPPRYWDIFTGKGVDIITLGINPFRQSDWPNPTPVTWYREWVQNLQEFVPVTAPFTQYDWPNPTSRSWDIFASHGLDLTTLALNPFNQTDWPNPIPFNRLDQFLGSTLLQSTIAPSTAKPFSQTDWVNPQPVYWFRDYNNTLALLLPPPAPVTGIHYHQFPQASMGTMGAFLHY